MFNNNTRSDSPSDPKAGIPVGQSPRLLEQVRNIIRCRHYSIRTENSYLDWIKRYIYFHDKQHPEQLDERHISAFLSLWPLIERSAAQPRTRRIVPSCFSTGKF